MGHGMSSSHQEKTMFEYLFPIYICLQTNTWYTGCLYIIRRLLDIRLGRN